MIDFKKIISDEMAHQNLSCTTLSKKCGLTSRIIAYYVNGERAQTLETAIKVLAALGLSLQVVKKGTRGEAGGKGGEVKPL